MKIDLKSTVIHLFNSDLLKLKEIRKFIEENLERKTKEIRAKKTIPAFNLKKKSVVALKLTYNGKQGYLFLDSILNKNIPLTSIRETGFTIGLKEYCDLSIFPYTVELPLFGLDISFNFTSRGSRIAQRKRNKKEFKNLCNKEEIISILKERGYEIQ